MFKEDSKYIIGSLIAHLALVSVFFYNSSKSPSIPEPIEITMTDQQQQLEPPKEESGVLILPKEDEGPEKKDEKDKGYYGIGITTNDHFENDVFIVEVTSVVYGYPADMVGLQIGDKIIEVDGQPIQTGQEIKGTGKTSLTIKVIKKNGIVTFIRLVRDFIRTEH